MPLDGETRLLVLSWVLPSRKLCFFGSTHLLLGAILVGAGGAFGEFWEAMGVSWHSKTTWAQSEHSCVHSYSCPSFKGPPSHLGARAHMCDRYATLSAGCFVSWFVGWLVCVCVCVWLCVCECVCVCVCVGGGSPGARVRMRVRVREAFLLRKKSGHRVLVAVCMWSCV